MPSREALSTFASNSKNSALSWGSWALTGLKTRAHSAWESARPQISAFSVKAFDLAWNNKAAVVSAAAAAGITLAVVRLWDRAFPTDAVAAAHAETERAKKDAKEAATKAQTDIDAVRKSIAPQLAEAEAAQKRAWEASTFVHNQMERMQAELEASNKTITTLKDRVAVLEARNESLERQLTVLKEARDALTAASPERNRALAAAEEKARAAEVELEQRTQHLTAIRENTMRENETLLATLAALQGELTKQQESSDRLVTDWTTKNETLQRTLRAVSGERATADNRIAALATELRAAREEAAAAGKTAGERITALETELTRAREEATAAGERIAALETELAEARKVAAASGEATVEHRSADTNASPKQHKTPQSKKSKVSLDE